MKSCSLNHTYRLIWSDVQQAFIAVAEFTRTKGKQSSKAAVLLASALLSGSALAAGLPTGGQVIAGAGSLSQSGNTLTIHQQSQRLATDWQSFSIGQGNTVNFVQPNSSAVALNRVIGADVSVIQGALNANGQVFLVNPNGVLFSPTAQVNVGGLVASTLNISTADFMAGNYRFSGNSTATVVNQGQIQAKDGGSIALLAARVENHGQLTANAGNVLLGAGKTIRLDLGGPVKLVIEEGVLNAVIEQGGGIRADGGLVYLTAKAAGDLASSVINHTGVIEARTLSTGKTGEIVLLGDMAHGAVNVAGKLDASAGQTQGTGGFIETSAAKVKVTDSAQIKSKQWLIDPYDFIIAANGGDMSGTALSNALANTSVTIQSTNGTATGNGDIAVKDAVTWNSANKLTLSAQRNISIEAAIAAQHANGQVQLEYGQGALAASNTASYSLSNSGKINLQAGDNFFTKLGSDGGVTVWKVITALGNAGSSTGTDLQGINGALGVNYVLGADIDASATSGWNSGAGFAPIGNATTSFTGKFDGLGHTISNLTINRPTTDSVGLFGAIGAEGGVRQVGLVGGSITGQYYVGSLAGGNAGHIERAYATAAVHGEADVGGLVGSNYGDITLSHATGNVTATANFAGGLVGDNHGGLSQVHATGAVSAGSFVGGLVGDNKDAGTIEQAYATGNVTATGDNAGGLAGSNSGNVLNSYATNVVHADGDNAGGLIGTNLGYVSSSYATGNTSGQNAVGGLVGRNEGEVDATHATGNVTAASDYAGGLVGKNLSTALIDLSYASGAVNGQSTVGGLAGLNEGEITRSYSTGNVAGSFSVGGLVGVNKNLIDNTYATGSVTGQMSVGGLVGDNLAAGSINHSYAQGLVTGTSGLGSGNTPRVNNGQDVGGLVGFNLGSVSNSFWNTETSSQSSSAGGTGKTTAEMRNIATFSNAGWNIQVDSNLTGETYTPRLSSHATGAIWLIKPTAVSYAFNALTGTYTYKGTAYNLGDYWTAASLFGESYRNWILGTDYVFQYAGNTVSGFTNTGIYSGLSVLVLRTGFVTASLGNTLGTFTVTAVPAPPAPSIEPVDRSAVTQATQLVFQTPTPLRLLAERPVLHTNTPTLPQIGQTTINGTGINLEGVEQ